MNRKKIYKRFQNITEDMFSEKHWGEATEIIDDMVDYIEELQSTIEAQEIIIKDMAQPKTCEGCKYSLIDGTSSKFYIDCKDCTRSGLVDNYQPKAQP